ncbi:(S)-2,3-di-O-geranylgeranylglyceryl phosphate synthase [Poriferisphaera corsica]|uniref:(S)-2,3-di-O-geranylgeranylglyceryl phosphate synthase n=1 Tax=Poriferisphaera corsica TaxID=2528020 RepID=A0A517YRF9_9BACT|nr:UbiA family prenyltransferase [Poriferisphaera corsica]QDU32804.1 (S)-2,3-di-O-geranylgeranylglyceryl phosphate synthase [Poriferisphaera corsica]
MNHPSTKTRINLRDILHLFELGRGEVILTLIANIWLMTFILHRDDNGLTPILTLHLILVTLIALGLAGLGIALNDVLDARHDRAFAPKRPIPAGRVNVRFAIAAAVVSMIDAVAASIWLGELNTTITLITVGGILFYNLTGRFMPAVGVVSLGLITSLVMLIPDPRPEYAWPIILAMTHVMFCSTARHWLANKRPRLTAKDGFGICAGWLFWSMLIVGVLRPHENPIAQTATQAHIIRLMLGPVLAIIVFAIITSIMFGKAEKLNITTRRQLGLRYSRIAGLWLIVYDVAWLIGLGMYWQAIVMTALLLLAVLIICLGKIIHALIGSPPTFGLSDQL